MRIKTIILDFDGTIVESVGIKDWAFRSLFEEYSDKLDEIMEYHLSHNATIRFEKFKFITEHILKQKYNGEVEKKLSQRFSELVFKRIINCPYVPGAIEFLDYYYKILPLYLVSVSPEDELDKILIARDLKKYFKRIYSSSWKKPEAITDILQRERLTSEEVLFVGDSPEDYQSAKASKILFIGIDSGKSFQNGQVNVFKDFVSIMAYISKFDPRENHIWQTI